MSCSDNRIASVASAVKSEGADVFYTRNTPNIEWLTGFQGVFDDEQAHAALIPCNGERPIIFTDSRYSTAMLAANSSCQFDIKVNEGLVPSSINFEKITIEDSLSLKEYNDLKSKLPTVSFAETSDIILRMRSVKDDDELAIMREAQAVTDKAFAHILNFLKPGLTEREIQLELDNYMLMNGADGLAFPTIIASGPNGASPHAIVSSRKVQMGDSIVMDFGARKNGYCSDMTRTVFIGNPNEEMRRAWDVLRSANEEAEQKLRVGMTGAEAHQIALDVLSEGGFEGRMGHSLGHGVGIEIHEQPILSPRNKEPLTAGNVVTVEPGIYIPGAFGMRLEDCGVITEAGYEPFTQSTHEMIVI